MGKVTKAPDQEPPSLMEAIGGRVGRQIAALLGISLGLGLAFNSANPIGVQFSPKNPKATVASPAPKDWPAAPAQNQNPAVLPSSPVPAAPEPAPAQPPPIPVAQPAISTQTNFPLANPTPAAPPAAPALVALALPIHWPEAKAILASGNAIMVDARSKNDFATSHIPGAVSLPEVSGPEEIQAFQKQHDASTQLIIYCGSQSCSLSKRLADRLVQQYGFTRVRYMTGGFQEWQQYEGTNALVSTLPPDSPVPAAPAAPDQPVVTVASQASLSGSVNSETASAPSPPAAPAIVTTPITWAETKPLLASANIVLVDARTKANFEAGHIPGSVSLPEASTLEEFQAFAAKHPPTTRLVIYCSSTSCSLSKRMADKLVREYGYQNVHYMTGGYLEYQKEEFAAPKPGS